MEISIVRVWATLSGRFKYANKISIQLQRISKLI